MSELEQVAFMQVEALCIAGVATLTPPRFGDARGCLLGFLTLEPRTEIQYKADDFYHRESDGVIAWNDPDLVIDWPLAEAGVVVPILSEKDREAPGFADFVSPFNYRS